MAPYVLDFHYWCHPDAVCNFHNDHLGAPQVITDETGAVVWRADYEPFGKANVVVGLIENEFRFPGQYRDAETGLHQNWFREYGPGIGRYVEADPLRLETLLIAYQSSRSVTTSTAIAYGLGQPQAANSYAYAQDHPVNWIDPRGLFGLAVDAGGGIGTGWGEQDPGAIGHAAGTGFYIGTKVQKGHPLELGGFTYQAQGKTPGARIGLGVNLTLYYPNAEEFFAGESKYTSMTVGLLSLTKYENACGETTGWTISLVGKGLGFTWLEKGIVESLMWPLR